MSRSPRHACAALLLAAGCSSDRASLDHLSRSAEPHLDTFLRFETWTERALSAVDPMAENETRAETLFAPIRLDGNILFAEVVSAEGRHRRKLHFPREALFEGTAISSWRRIDHAHMANLAVLDAAQCPVTAPPWWRDGATKGPCLLLSHETHWGDQNTLQITVAFRTTEDP